MYFGGYQFCRNFNIEKILNTWFFIKRNEKIDENENTFNLNVLDSIIDDDDSKFIELVTPVSNDDTNPNQLFRVNKYNFPKILSSRPTYASLCAFFGAEKCFSALSMICPGGISSEEFKRPDDENRSPIHFACAGGNLNIIRELYNAGYDLNKEDDAGNQPSYYSAMAGTTDVIKYLYSKGANVLKCSSNNIMTPFHIACLYGNLDIIIFLCEKIGQNDQILRDYIHYRFTDNITPLHLACDGGHSNVVDYILSKKEIGLEQVKLFDHENLTPLLVACKNGCLQCVKSLVKFGVLEIDSANKYSALVKAAAGGFSDIVKYLLQQKEIDINELSTNQLEAAIINGRLEVFEIFVENGALKNKSEQEIGDLFFAACGTFNMKIINYLDSILDIPYEKMGNLFMRQACKIENEELVNFLLSKKCSLESVSINDFNFRTKWTPFMTFLKEKGLDMTHLCSKSGVPAIIKTIKSGSFESLKKMISEGIVLTKEMIEENDLVNVACNRAKYDLFSFLIKYNPNLTNPTLCFDNIMKILLSFKSKNNSKRANECYKIAETLLKVYKVIPTNRDIINEVVSKCFMDLIVLLSKHGAVFNFCNINFYDFKAGNYSEVLLFFKTKNVDFNTLYSSTSNNLLIVESLLQGETNMFHQLISYGATFDIQLIGKFNLLEKALDNNDLNILLLLLNYHPMIPDPSLYFMKIFSFYNLNYYRKEVYQITEILLRDYHLNPNDMSAIQYAASNCMIDFLRLFKQYGADFNSFEFEYDQMINEKHLRVFIELERNGCLFKKAKKYKPTYLHKCMTGRLTDEENQLPIKINLENVQNPSYDYRTFLFLLRYTTNEEIINLRFKKDPYHYLSHTKDQRKKEANIIDVLLSIRCFVGIWQVYEKLDKVIFPILKTEEEYKNIINECPIQDLKNMVL